MFESIEKQTSKFDRYFLLPFIAAIILSIMAIPIAFMDSIAAMEFNTIGMQGALHIGLVKFPQIFIKSYMFFVVVALLMEIGANSKSK